MTKPRDRTIAFRECTPFEAGFAAVFARAIAPALEDMEARRQARLAGWRRRLGFASPLVMAALAGAVLLPVGWGEAGLTIRLLLLVAAAALVKVLVAGRRTVDDDGPRQVIVPSLLAFVGEVTYQAHPAGTFDLDPFRDAGLLKRADMATLRDRFEGSRHGVRYHFAQALLSRKNFRNDQGFGARRSVFSGLLIMIGSAKATAVRDLAGLFADVTGLPARRIRAAAYDGGALITVARGPRALLAPPALWRPVAVLVDDIHLLLAVFAAIDQAARAETPQS